MRSYQKTEWVGEKVGEIDYAYDFSKHFLSYCCSDEHKAEMCKRHLQLLKEVDEEYKQGKRISVNMDGYWKELYDIGMYDGWPYWKPVPALFTSSPLGGGEWHFFYNLEDWKESVTAGAR